MSGNDADAEVADPMAIGQQWTDASRHAVNSYVEANNALFAAMGIDRESGEADCERTDAPVAEVAFGDAGWSMERTTDEYDELGVGDYVRFSKPLVERDVNAFAQASGDTNRLHLEDVFADGTRFKGRIVHGTLVAGTISAALARLPGLTIYLSQDLEFNAPVRIGERVTAECEIVEDLGEHRYRLATAVYDEDDEAVIDGEAVVLIDEQPDV
ncbi:MaoC family dehydratase [Natronoarchaeum mannanilyticum]|uniref:MaoC-like domain-containing protein n=1 Tax=Natronoarchaeum mannanilyticum TaxID=926360 RepID=A0AAV3T911_9EURY